MPPASEAGPVGGALSRPAVPADGFGIGTPGCGVGVQEANEMSVSVEQAVASRKRVGGPPVEMQPVQSPEAKRSAAVPSVRGWGAGPALAGAGRGDRTRRGRRRRRGNVTVSSSDDP